MTNKDCGCSDVKACIGIPKNADSWNTPNYTGCNPGSLPGGLCEGYDCIKKTPACSIEGGHALKLIKLSKYIDLDKFATLDLNNIQEKLPNADALSKLTGCPLTKIHGGVNTQVIENCDGSVQINHVTPIAQSVPDSVSHCDVSGTDFFVTTGEVHESSIAVFISPGQYIPKSDYEVIFNGTNTIIKLNNPVTNACLDINFTAVGPEVVVPQDCLVKVDGGDVAGLLETKVSGGAGITVTPQSFGGASYLEISQENALPVPTVNDANNIVYYNAETGLYELGSPCCEGGGFGELIGTDDVSVDLNGDNLQFVSNDLDIIFSDVDSEDGVQEVQIDLAEDAELFTIVNEDGTQSSIVTPGTDLSIKSEDGTIQVQITDGCINLEATPDTPNPIRYEFTDGDTRNVNHGNTIEYESDCLDITNSGNTHEFNCKPCSYGGVYSNDNQDIPGGSVETQILFDRNYDFNNISLAANGSNQLVAQEDGLHDIISNITWRVTGEDTAVLILMKVNGNVVSQNRKEFDTNSSQYYTHTVNQHLDLNAGDIVTMCIQVSKDDNETFEIQGTREETYLHMYKVR